MVGIELKQSISEILSSTYMGKYQQRYEHRPTLCLTLLTMCETYSAQFNVSYQTLLTNLVDCGLGYFVTEYKIFKNYTDALGDKFDPIEHKDTSNYKHLGVKIAGVIEHWWPNKLSKSSYRPRMYVRDTYEPYYNKMTTLCNLESYVLIKMFLAFAFQHKYEDTVTYSNIRSDIHEILREV